MPTLQRSKDIRAVLHNAHGPSISLNHILTGEVIRHLELGNATADHRSFIISTWLKSYRGLARRQGIQEFYDAHEPAIAESRWHDCTVATDEDGYTVYAWICGTNGSLWHTYVIPELRMYGVSKVLIELVCGAVPDLARPWPYRTRSRINPYLLKVRDA